MIRFFLLLFLLTPSLSFAKTAVQIKIEFPYGQDSVFGVQMYQKGVLGPASQDLDFPLTAQITVANCSQTELSNLTLFFDIDAPLSFIQSMDNHESTQQTEKHVETLAPNTNQSFKIFVKRPRKEDLLSQKTSTSIHYKALLKNHQTILEGTYALNLKKASSPWLIGLITLSSLIGLILLLLCGGYRSLFSSYTTAEIVTIAIFISFYVASALLSHILKTFGAPSLLVHFFWVVCFWSLLVCLLRFVPKKGAVLIFVFGGAIILDLLLWGFNPIQILTYTLCSGLILEIWFRFTGFGKNIFSVLGAGVVYFIYPICFYWFFVGPVLYHYYYTLWYIGLWLTFNIVSYFFAGLCGYFFANRLIKVVK